MKKKILSVDDDPLVIRMYQNKLSSDGYQVFEASNGNDGFEMAKKEKPDLIFLDLMMPNVDGIMTLKMLKGEAGTKSIPVIILTNVNHGQEIENAKKAKQMGALDYLVKSQIDLKKLSKVAAEILSK